MEIEMRSPTKREAVVFGSPSTPNYILFKNWGRTVHAFKYTMPSVKKPQQRKTYTECPKIRWLSVKRGTPHIKVHIKLNKHLH